LLSEVSKGEQQPTTPSSGAPNAPEAAGTATLSVDGASAMQELAASPSIPSTTTEQGAS